MKEQRLESNGNGRRLSDTEIIQRISIAETQIKEYKDFVSEKFISLERTTELARQSMDKRLDGMNEFREALKDQANRGITRTEHDALISKYDGELKSVCKSLDTMEGKASQKSVNATMILAGISIIISIISLIKEMIK